MLFKTILKMQGSPASYYMAQIHAAPHTSRHTELKMKLFSVSLYHAPSLTHSVQKNVYGANSQPAYAFAMACAVTARYAT